MVASEVDDDGVVERAEERHGEQGDNEETESRGERGIGEVPERSGDRRDGVCPGGNVSAENGPGGPRRQQSPFYHTFVESEPKRSAATSSAFWRVHERSAEPQPARRRFRRVRRCPPRSSAPRRRRAAAAGWLPRRPHSSARQPPPPDGARTEDVTGDHPRVARGVGDELGERPAHGGRSSPTSSPLTVASARTRGSRPRRRPAELVGGDDPRARAWSRSPCPWRGRADLHLALLEVAGRPVVHEHEAEDVRRPPARRRCSILTCRRRPPPPRARSRAQVGGREGDRLVGGDDRARVAWGEVGVVPVGGDPGGAVDRCAARPLRAPRTRRIPDRGGAERREQPDVGECCHRARH